MNANILINTNPYLKDATNRWNLVRRSVRTSCGVEGIHAKTSEIEVFNIPSRGSKKIYKNLSK